VRADGDSGGKPQLEVETHRGRGWRVVREEKAGKTSGSALWYHSKHGLPDTVTTSAVCLAWGRKDAGL